jgi:hypothetical protein
MRSGALWCLFVGACSFETRVPPNGNFETPDAATATTPDTAPDATLDAMPKVCAAAYVAVSATGTQSKYRRNQAQTAWLTAKADCASDGGHLAIPNTVTEAKAIFAFIDPLDTSPYFWAGISDPELDGQWVTVTNVPFTAMVWGDNDPDQRAGEIYAIVDRDGNTYDWFDDGTQEYACECTP